MSIQDKGRVVWITGLSAAGKSTIAEALAERLRADSVPVAVLDGDQVREAVADESCCHDRASRIVNAYRICRMAVLLAKQGLTVIVATMSLYHEIHDWNRENMPGYLEVLLKVDMDVLKARDPKGIYAGTKEGTTTNVAGVDLDIELPASPHLTIHNNGSADDIVPHLETIIAAFMNTQ